MRFFASLWKVWTVVKKVVRVIDAVVVAVRLVRDVYNQWKEAQHVGGVRA